ncbi:hypothetical protein C9413_26310 [Rhizobium sp. SEMIA 4085]|uniref:Peptidase GluZincin family protein n=1 Tax=Rhizobium gallicum bv. gallicum R602sp TaxID=1041138 RepID=A0A0B4X673_9HYPH|nr:MULTISPECIES: hypothetical protein [Rhizobium]AJD43589.1 peptidase GluZincin family protein [Rhizobium gallicum bv. gallicum R602sp]NNH32829.1 hypothetical protein [Rhizobium sp. SEMIA 4085]
MKRFVSDYATRAAEKRKLRIYATDPMSGRRAPYRITVEVDNEPELSPGPVGEIVEVIDYDGWNKKFYGAVDLNDPALLMESGLAPSESDPRFHQQMVYAVAMKVVESARRALGRPINFRKSSTRTKLRLVPHAFCGKNAFFDPDLNAIMFGYFQADAVSPGPNIPSQTVFTCLSHDIIAHEMTHAIVHRLRPYFIEPSNIDVLAFHEAFSDIVALFQRFSYRELLAEHIQTSQGMLQKSEMLVELAQQFGYAAGRGKALRSAIGKSPKLAETHEPHDRGAILVSAVFGGYFDAYQKRIADLLRIATGGSGQLPTGRLHPDLVNRLAGEASQLAERFLRMCFRAFDYMPPVDVTFGDFLRALVTSDFELNPQDSDEVRFSIIEAFRERGIYPAGVVSLAEESLLWPSQINGQPPPVDAGLLEDARRFLNYSATALDQGRIARRSRSRNKSESATSAYESTVIETDEAEAEVGGDRLLRDGLFSALTHYARFNLDIFGLDPNLKVAVVGFHAVHRITSDQRLVIEFVAQFMQIDEQTRERFRGIPFRGGATVIFGSEGEVRYIASKPMKSENLPPEFRKAATARLHATDLCLEELDRRDPMMAFADEEYLENRMKLRAQFRALHGEG